MKNGNKNRGFYVEEKRNMFGGVYILVYNVYITSEAKNNKVNYCSDEKERKIRGKGPP